MDHKSCRKQSLNLNILCSQSSIMIFPQINMKPPNNSSTCCICSRRGWYESLVTHRLAFYFQSSRFVMVFRFSLHQNSDSFHIKSAGETPQISQQHITLVRTIETGGILCPFRVLTSAKQDVKRV